jgi:hypothetical protein
MKRFQSILCASLLTLSLSSVALAGQISGRAGQISGGAAPDTTITGQISGRPGQISGFEEELTGLIVSLLAL